MLYANIEDRNKESYELRKTKTVKNISFYVLRCGASKCDQLCAKVVKKEKKVF